MSFLSAVAEELSVAVACAVKWGRVSCCGPRFGSCRGLPPVMAPTPVFAVARVGVCPIPALALLRTTCLRDAKQSDGSTG